MLQQASFRERREKEKEKELTGASDCAQKAEDAPP